MGYAVILNCECIVLIGFQNEADIYEPNFEGEDKYRFMADAYMLGS